MSLLELKGVTKEYSRGRVSVKALRGIDLSIEPGEFLSIAGPSGSGKSTLLNLVGCLDVPTSGSIILDGEPLEKLNPQELALVRREKVGFIFQTFNLIPVLTAFENVELPLVLLKEDPKTIKDKVMKILEAVGIADLADRRPQDMSGGQQQRVAIARALVKEPKYVLADEPTANLDSENGKAVLEIMREMNERLGTTFIFSTHDQMVMDFAKRLVRLKDGQIISDERR
ncbi:MAG: ABC transporter ATP-binding protein [Firmicutes bacterium]|nr:ABC transporter ATP-binding protein [Bacillota bacterium]